MGAANLAPAIVCEECGAIVGRGDDQYPDNHWEWCSKAAAGNGPATRHPVRNPRLSGHALHTHGSAYQPSPGRPGSWIPVWGSQSGVGLCQCGETSPPLESDDARKAWHRGHKDALRGAFDGAPGHG